jgi:hypothetical protein
MSDARRHGRRAFKVIMRSFNFNTPKYDLPLRIQPVSSPSLFGAFSTQSPHPLYRWFVASTVLIMLSPAFLGLTNVVIYFH